MLCLISLSKGQQANLIREGRFEIFYDHTQILCIAYYEAFPYPNHDTCCNFPTDPNPMIHVAVF